MNAGNMSNDEVNVICNFIEQCEQIGLIDETDPINKMILRIPFPIKE